MKKSDAVRHSLVHQLSKILPWVPVAVIPTQATGKGRRDPSVITAQSLITTSTIARKFMENQQT